MIFKKQRKIALFFVGVVAMIALLSSFAFANSFDYVSGDDLTISSVAQELHKGYSVQQQTLLIEDDLTVESGILKENGKWYIETADEVWKKDKDADKIKIKDKELCLDDKGKEKKCDGDEKAEKIKYEINKSDGTRFHIGATSDVYELVNILVYNVSGKAIYAALYRDGVAENGYDIEIINGKFGASLTNTTPGNLSWRFWSDDFKTAQKGHGRIGFTDGDDSYYVADYDVCSQTSYTYGSHYEEGVGETIGWHNRSAGCSYETWAELTNTETIYDATLDTSYDVKYYRSYASINFFGNETDPTFVLEAGAPNVYLEDSQIEGTNKTHITVNDSDIVVYFAADSDENKSFTGEAYDWSSNENDGTIEDNAHLKSSEDRYRYFELDGTGDQVNLGDIAEVDFASNDFSISAWMKTSSNTDQMLVGKDDNVAGGQFFLQYRGPDNKVRMRYYKSGSVAVTTDTSIDLEDGEWHHIVGQRNGSNMEIFVDGVHQIAGITSGTAGAMQATSSELTIGARTYSGAQNYFTGSLDDVMIYDKLLTGAEVSSIYNNQTSRFNDQGNVTLQSQEVTLSSNNTANVTFNDAFAPTGTNASVNIGGWWNESGYTGLTHPDLSSTLVSHWSFDGNANDEAENNDGAFSSSTAHATSEDGVYGGELRLYDTSVREFVQVADDSSLDITSAITIAGWVNVDTSKSGGRNQYMVDKQNIYSVIIKDDETIQFYMKNVAPASMISSGSISLNQWHHIAVTFDSAVGSNDKKIYIDGVLDSEISTTGTIGSDNNVLRLGCYSNSGGSCATSWHFDGSMDDIMIFNKALNQSELSEIYSIGLLNLEYNGSAKQIISNQATSISYNNQSTHLVPLLTMDSDSNNHFSPVVDVTTALIETYQQSEAGPPPGDTTNPLVTVLTEEPTDPATYVQGAQYRFNSTVTDDVAVDTVILTFDGVNYSTTNIGSVFSANVTDLAAGTYNYNWWANDTSGNINSTESGTYTVDKASQTSTLLLNGVASNVSETYPATINASASCSQSTLALTRNGTDVLSENNLDISLSPGIYNYSATCPTNENYSSSQTEYTFTLSKNSSYVLDITFSPSDSETYGTTTTVTGINCPTQLTCTLYRNGTPVSNPDVGTQSAGIHEYTYNTTGNENYTSQQVQENLTISKASSTVDLKLDGTSSNITVSIGSTVNESASLTTGQGELDLLEEGTLVQTGASPVEKLTTYNTAGVFSVTSQYNATENYTASSQTYYVTVLDDSPPEINVTGCVPDPASLGQVVQCNVTVTDETALSNGTTTTVAINMNQEGAYADGFSTGSTKDDTATTMSVGDFFSTFFRSYADFNTTSIPDGSTITDVKLQLTKAVDTNITMSFTVLTNFSTDFTAAGVHNECGPTDAGLYYVANSTIWDSLDQNIPTNQTLGSLANNHLESNLTNNRFSVCMYSEDGEQHSNEFIDFHTNESTTAAYRPVLYVTYTEGASPVEANVTMSNGTVEEQTVFNDGNVYYFSFTNTDNVGLHNVTWMATDNSSNVANAVDNFTVNAAVDSTNPQVTVLTESPSDPATYSPTQVYNFTSNVTDNIAVDTVIFTWDNTNYSANKNGNIYWFAFTGAAAGTYNYSWFANDTSGNINLTLNQTYTINKASSQCNLTASSPISYPNNVTASLSCNHNQQTAELFKDGSPIASPYSELLGVGTYNISTRFNASQNYTAATINWSVVTVNKGTPIVNLTLNDVDNNLTIGLNENVTYNATLISGQGNIELIENITVINTGASPLVNVSSFTSPAVINITVRYNATQNYSAINYTHVLTIEQINGTLNITFVDIGREFVKISWT